MPADKGTPKKRTTGQTVVNAMTAVSPVMTLLKSGSQIAKSFGSNNPAKKVKPSLSENLAGGVKQEKKRVNTQKQDLDLIMKE